MLIEDLTRHKGGITRKAPKPDKSKMTIKWDTPTVTKPKVPGGLSGSVGLGQFPSKGPFGKGEKIVPYQKGSNGVPGGISKPTLPQIGKTGIPAPQIDKPSYTPVEQPPVKIVPPKTKPETIPDIEPDLIPDFDNKLDKPIGTNRWDSSYPDPGQAYAEYLRKQKEFNKIPSPLVIDPEDEQEKDLPISPEEEQKPKQQDIKPDWNWNTTQGTPEPIEPKQTELSDEETAFWLDKNTPYNLEKNNNEFYIINKKNALEPIEKFSSEVQAKKRWAELNKQYLEKNSEIKYQPKFDKKPIDFGSSTNSTTNKLGTGFPIDFNNFLGKLDSMSDKQKIDFFQSYSPEDLDKLQNQMTNNLQDYLSKTKEMQQQDYPDYEKIKIYNDAIKKLRKNLKELGSLKPIEQKPNEPEKKKKKEKIPNEVSLDDQIKELGKDLFDSSDSTQYNQEVAAKLIQKIEAKYDLSGLNALPILYFMESSGGINLSGDNGNSIGGLHIKKSKGSFDEYKRLVDKKITWKDVQDNQGLAMQIGGWYYRLMLDQVLDQPNAQNWSSYKTGKITFTDKDDKTFAELDTKDVPIALIYAAIKYNGGPASVDKNGVVKLSNYTSEELQQQMDNNQYIAKFNYATRFIKNYLNIKSL